MTASLEAEGVAAPFDFNIYEEKNSYENQNERQSWWD